MLVGTFALTVVFDLTVAVQAGLVLACVFFIYRMSMLFSVEPIVVAPAGVRVLRLYGTLFFGAVTKVEAIAEQVPAGTRVVVLEMHRLISIDNSGLDALVQLHRVLARQNVRMMLCDLNEQPRDLVHRSGFDGLLGFENLAPDLDSALARVAT